MKILILAPHIRDRSPSQRYRFEQYLSAIGDTDYSYDISYLLNLKSGYTLYGQGNYIHKIWIVFRCFFKRLKDVWIAPSYDTIYIHKSAFPIGALIERLIRKRSKKIIFDFDDAIWLMDKNPNQGIFNKLKNPNKTAKIIALSDRVITGNEYLANYARQFNPDVCIIPSTIDMKKYSVQKKSNSHVCIGWTGSFSTIKHFETVIPALVEIKKRHPTVYFKLIGDPTYKNNELGIQGVKWKSETEAQDLSELDIGLMPLPDNPWTQGKCAMKGLQYMALGIPTIMSPIGVNKDIIKDGTNGFLASSDEEWVDKLSLLIESETLRNKVGEAGRKTVESEYSVEANREKWLHVFEFDD